MDGKAALRRYLEQRRELGESEFVLDSMNLDDALKTIGAFRANSAAASRRAISRESAAPSVASAAESMARIQASRTEPAPAQMAAAAEKDDKSTGSTPRYAFPAPQDESVKPPAGHPTQGLVVGSANENLFAANPFASCTTLGEVAAMVDACKRCGLYATATNPVPGEGNPDADLMCVGEAPGANEDATGRPFVGAAGQLLTKILAAIKLAREDVFIANVLKHRPPGNRNPMPNEVEACSPYLIRQIELVRPKVIVAFGTFAAQTLLETKTPIGKLRGMVHRYHGVPLVVTYHPAALLRNPAWKRPTWEDVQLARRILDDATV